MMMTLSEDDLEPRGPKTAKELVSEVRWRCPALTFDRQNIEFVLDSLRNVRRHPHDAIQLLYR